MDPEVKVEYNEPQAPAPVPDVDNLTIQGFIPTVSAAPTHTPTKTADQIRIYQSGATYRLYIYDTVNNVWKYSALT